MKIIASFYVFFLQRSRNCAILIKTLSWFTSKDEIRWFTSNVRRKWREGFNYEKEGIEKPQDKISFRRLVAWLAVDFQHFRDEIRDTFTWIFRD